MNIMKFFNRKRKNRKIKDVKMDDTILNMETVYNVAENFMILMTFSEKYFIQMIEFLSYVHMSPGIKIQFTSSIYSEFSDDTDEYGHKERIIHDKYYLLIGGSPDDYLKLFYHADNIVNDVLQAIAIEIYHCRNVTEFAALIDDGVLNINAFHKDLKTPYDKYLETETSKRYDNTGLILGRLPECFTGQSLLKFINCYDINEYHENINAFELLRKAYDNHDIMYKSLVNNEYKYLYMDLIRNPSESVFRNFIGPQYMVQSDEAIPGDMTDSQLDVLFREQYEKFSAVADTTVIYEDIDEKLADDEESENMRDSDKLPNNESEDDYNGT